MLIATMNDVPGYKVTSVLGEVFGLTVRSRNVGSSSAPPSSPSPAVSSRA
jgi:uncharacterized protein YbjQ (UPF0145 family)